MAQDNAPPGIIDTLSAGFSSINRIAWILLVPVLLDLFLWQGPRLSAQPVAQQVVNWYSEQAATASPAAGEAILASEAQLAQRLSSFNVLYFLALHGGTVALVFGGVNVSGPKIGTIPLYMVGQASPGPTAAQISGAWELFLIALLLGLAGLLLGSGYMGVIAQQVRGHDLDGKELFNKLGRNWVHSIGLMFGGIVALTAVMFPVSLVLGLLVLFSQSLGLAVVLLTWAALQVAFMAAFIYLFFTVDAIVVSGVGPVHALRNSIAVVNSNFWPAVGLMLLSFVILAGTQIIWSMLAHQSLGPVPGILGNAYIASGLTASSMLFYRDRLALVERKNNVGTEIRTN